MQVISEREIIDSIALLRDNLTAYSFPTLRIFTPHPRVFLPRIGADMYPTSCVCLPHFLRMNLLQSCGDSPPTILYSMIRFYRSFAK
jgi:hypothetical protein